MRSVHVGFGAFGACCVMSCLVSVDESLVDRTTGPSPASQEAGAPAEAGSADATPAAEASVYAGMACGSQRCLPSATQVCCTGSNGDPDPTHGSCGNAPDCRTGDFFRCMGPADCAYLDAAAPVCCATDFSGGGFSHSGCKTACTGTDVELCDPNGPACPPPRTCKPSSEYKTLFACE